MATLNKLMLIGRLTADPEPPKVLPSSGSTVINFRFAVSTPTKDKSTGKYINDPRPLYIDCAVFSNKEGGGLTNVVQYMKKGTECYLEGKLEFEQWDDKDSPGKKRSKHKMTVNAIQLLGDKSSSDSTPAANDGGGSPAPANDSGDGGDFPF